MLDNIERVIGKITDIDRLPTYEEARQLFLFFEAGKQIQPNENPWSKFCDENGGIWSVYTVEFVEGLAQKIRDLNGTPVVEVCAGDGKLSHQLRMIGIDIKATDDYSFGSIRRKEDLVERLPYWEALEAYRPKVVLGGWSPVGSMRRDILAFPTVAHFLEFPFSGKDGYRATDDIRKDDVRIVSFADVAQHYICRNDGFPEHFSHDVKLFSK